MTIQEWLLNNSIDHHFISDTIFTVNEVGKFLVVSDKDKMFDEDLNLVLSEEEGIADPNFYCYKFGSNWYYSKDIHVTDFTILKYIGRYKSDIDLPIPFLGVHGGFDILNGSRSYGDWIKKAKWLGISSLGVCEKNTLGGVLKFQIKCQKEKITPIIGYQVCVHQGDAVHYVKLYVENQTGWDSLLHINKIVNIDNIGFIDRNDLLKRIDGLIVVLDPKYLPFEESLPYQLHILDTHLFWGLDSVEFSNDGKDKEYLLNVKQYLSSPIPPALIYDAYYLDKDDGEAKVMLNNIADRREFASEDQHFKSIDEVFTELSLLFNDDRILDLFEKSAMNTVSIAERCTFTVELGRNLLPDYLMTEEEVKQYGDKETMFYVLIEDGFNRKTPKGREDEYLARLEKELDVIISKGFIDYFLILWDIIRWSRENNILVGVGRGSAGGSLIAFLLDITQLDPIRFNLLFERFLNAGRLEKEKEFKKLIINGKGDKVEFWEDDWVSIERNGHKIQIKAINIQKEDIILF